MVELVCGHCGCFCDLELIEQGPGQFSSAFDILSHDERTLKNPRMLANCIRQLGRQL